MAQRLEALVRRLTIRTKQGSLIPMTPNWAQSEFLEEIENQRWNSKPVRIIVLKARQLGISTASEAVMFWDRFIWEHTFGLVIAHSQDTSDNLFDMTRLYWENFPYKRLFTPKYLSKKEISWIQNGSSMRVATARNVGAGRGRTIHDMHASEFAFWEDPETLLLGLRQGIAQRPETMIVLESTANGVGNYFHNAWLAAENGESEFKALFFPWWREPAYTASAIGLPPESLGRLDSEEKLLKRTFHVDEDHLAWRRWAIVNLAGNAEEDFRQEYPSTPEDAFITSGTNVMPLERLKDCYNPKAGAKGDLRPGPKGTLEFVVNPSANLKVFRLPSKDKDWGRYFVGGDPAHLGGHDYAVIQVINRRTYEQVAVWRGKIDPVTFADELVKIARYYNMAWLSSEVEGPGYATIGKLLATDYPHIWRHRWADKIPGKVSQSHGWSSNWQRKQWAIDTLVKLVLDRSLEIHDNVTYEEMKNYVNLRPGEYGPGMADGYDDTVMALAIACICSMTDGPLSYYTSEEYRDQIEPRPAWESWE